MRVELEAKMHSLHSDTIDSVGGALTRQSFFETINVVPGESGTDKRADVFRKRNFVTRSCHHLLKAQCGIYLFRLGIRNSVATSVQDLDKVNIVVERFDSIRE